MAHDVRNNPDRSRYEIYVDDRLVGIADYEVDDRSVVFPHTEITPSLRGHGLGAELVRGALDDVRDRFPGRQVVPVCWYVAEFIDENPEYRVLVER